MLRKQVLSGAIGQVLVTMAAADTITVTTATDATGGAQCSLRDAIIAANTDTGSGGCAAGNGSDTIIFDGVLVGQSVVLTAPLPDVTSEMEITGPSVGGITIDGQGGDILTATPSFTETFTISSLDLANAQQVLHTERRTVLNNVTIANNTAAAMGAVVFARFTNVEFNNTAITDNTADAVVLGQTAQLTMNSSTVSNSTGTAISVFNDASITLNTSTLENNTSSAEGGGIRAMAGLVNVTRSTLRNNEASSGGGVYGGAYSTVQFNAATIVGNTAAAAGGGVAVVNAELFVNDGEFSGNTAIIQGGAIYHRGGFNPSVINDPRIDANSAALGGGIYRVDGAITLNRLWLEGNMASSAGQALYGLDAMPVLTDSTVTGHVGQQSVFALSGGSGRIESSTFYTNDAGSAPVMEVAGGDLTLINSTLSGNLGAALIEAQGTGDLVLRHVTALDQAGIAASGIDSLELTNSLLFASGDACETMGVPTIITQSLFSDNTCGGGTVTADPMLADLANNGGATLTRFPEVGSPLLDVGATSCEANDQRGVARQMPCDVGAVEVPGMLSPPRVDDQTFALLAPIMDGQVMGTVSASDDKPLPSAGAFSILSGDVRFAIDNAGTITATSGSGLVGMFSLRVQVTDSDGLSDSADVLVDIAPNDPPTIDSAVFALAADPGMATTLGTLMFSDPNNDLAPDQPEIVGGNDAGYFSLNGAALVFTGDGTVNGVFVLTLRVTDLAGQTDEAMVVVSIGEIIFLSGFEPATMPMR